MTATNVHKDPEAPTRRIRTELAATVERAWQLWADPRAARALVGPAVRALAGGWSGAFGLVGGLSHPLRRVGGVESGPGLSRQERVGREAEERAASLMGRMNADAARLVEVIVEVLDAEAWGAGGGLRSPEHWVCWRTGVSPARAKGLVGIARRVDELPLCVALFTKGSLTEDAMALIAAKAPAGRDGELAELAPMLLHSQLRRILAHLPDQEPKPPTPEPEREVRFGFREDGWWEGHQVLPPDEGALAQRALESARDELFHERAGDADAVVRGRVSWADAFVRVCEHALDGLDPASRRGQ